MCFKVLAAPLTYQIKTSNLKHKEWTGGSSHPGESRMLHAIGRATNEIHRLPSSFSIIKHTVACDNDPSGGGVRY